MSQSSRSPVSKSTPAESLETPRTSSHYAESLSSATAASSNARTTAHGVTADGSPHPSHGHEGPRISSLDRPSGSQFRSRRVRSSGGFLLAAPDAPSGHDRSTTHIQDSSFRKRGKAKDRVVPTETLRVERVRHPQHRHKPSVGCSPLAIEIKNSGAQEDGTSHGSPAQPYRRDVHAYNGHMSTDILDTDPSQIVNLALNLSENRRRYFSAARLPPIDPASGRRIASSGLGSLPATPALGASFRNQLNQHRRGSKGLPVNHLSKTDEPSRSSSALSDHESASTGQEPTFDAELLDDVTFAPSDATISRAEKARVVLELNYEYRRLLQCLPKLPPSMASRPGTSRTTAGKHDSHDDLGRAYNPLQYIRNRKVRIRERKRFNAEDSGWKDVLKVRAWVDEVAKEREEHVEKIDKKYPLPSFTPLLEEVPNASDSPASATKQSKTTTPLKFPPLPRMDWSISPWDMLADAYWIDQEDHKYLIQDRNGEKIFKPPQTRAKAIQRQSMDMTRPGSRRSGSMPRTWLGHDRKNSLQEIEKAGGMPERGRPLHKLNDSVTSVGHYSSSKERKGGWTQKLLRTASSSTSEDSLKPLPVDRRTRGRQTSQERKESAVLDRQVMSLLAKETEERDRKGGSGDESSSTSSSPVRSARDSPSVDKQTQERSTPRPLPSFITSDDKNVNQRSRLKSMIGVASDTDTTAPRSPEKSGSFPSIAINLSPPRTPPPRSKKPLPLPLSFSRDSSRHRRHSEKAGDADFAAGTIPPLQRHPSSSYKHDYFHKDVPNIAADFLSPRSAESFGRSSHRRSSDRSSKGGGKSDGEDLREQPRLRDRLRDSILGEIVGGQVSRLGGLVRKSGDKSHTSSYEGSETEGSPRSGATSVPISRITTNRSIDERVRGDRPQIGDFGRYSSKLPVFRSPFAMEVTQETQSPSRDHISRQISATRQRSRDGRLAKLAPGSLDTRSTSGSQPPPIRRLLTDATDLTELSRTSSMSRRDGRRDANAGIPYFGHGTARVPMTGLAGLSVQPEPPDRTPQAALESNDPSWPLTSPARQGSPSRNEPISHKDIVRVRALLLSSGVKSAGINNRAYKVADPPENPILRRLVRSLAAKHEVDLVPLCREHRLAARLLLSQVDTHVASIHSAAEDLTSKTLPILHENIKALDDRATYELTGLVRAAGDDADALTSELSGSRTLDVKRLDEGIAAMIRKRRRKFVAIRMLWFGTLEWVLKGILWVIWFTVFILRAIRGSVRFSFNAVRWLLFL